MLKLETKSIKICFNINSNVLTAIDKSTGYRLLFTPSAALFRPILDGKSVDVQLHDAKENGNSQLEFHFTGEELLKFIVILSAIQEEDAIDFQCKFTVKNPAQLNRLELFPAGTIVTAYDLVNFRNRHHTPNVWPELVLGTGVKTDTFSEDWQFAPHPTMFIFRKLKINMFFGAMEIPKAFGMSLDIEDKYKVKNWYLNYGPQPHGQVLKSGEEFISPRFRLFVRQEQGVYDTIDEFSKMLIKAGQIPDPKEKVRHSWWKEPVYCTWMDQCLTVKATVPDDLKTQALGWAPSDAPSITILTEEFVRNGVEIIKRENLPIKIILIDDGWEVSRGQWEPHPDRFPDFRKLVDDLHADGFKVIIWWNWAEIYEDAIVNPAFVMANAERLKAMGNRRALDYSNPAVQEKYLKPLFRKFFSRDPDCYDLDGVKTDFLADKVHPDMRFANPAWRGEENYHYQITKLFYTEMRRYKPDAMHMGCAGHFWLADMIDLNRTYDNGSTNFLVHQERGRMLKHTSPGSFVSYDLHNSIENFEGYFESASTHGASVQIGNVMYCQDDPFAEIRSADSAYYQKCRTLLEEYNNNRQRTSKIPRPEDVVF